MARASVLVWLVLAVTAAAGGLYAYWSRRVTVDKSVSPLPPRCADMGLGKMADGNGIDHVGSVLPAAFGGGVAQGGIGRLFVVGFV